MSDFNDGLLPTPCLRMDTHFGDEYESVEFGDGTGYIKAVPILARLEACRMRAEESLDMMSDDLETLQAENAKLRELVRDIADHIKHDDGFGIDRGWVLDRMRELGIEVDA